MRICASRASLLDLLGSALSPPTRLQDVHRGQRNRQADKAALVDGSQVQPRHGNVSGHGPQTASRHGNTHEEVTLRIELLQNNLTVLVTDW